MVRLFSLGRNSVTTLLKAVLSLLISVLLAAVFSAFAFTGFFNLVETRFYNPSITNSQNREVRRDADAIQGYFEEMSSKFENILKNNAIKQSFLAAQSAQDILERARLYGQLMESVKDLQSVRFIDAGGLRIHFSTSPADILSQSDNSITYKNYDEISPFIPYAELAVPKGEPARITTDQQNERILFSFPFMDSLDIYRGTAVYSLSTRALEDRLITEGRIKPGENISITSNPPGIVSGLPHAGKEALLSVISSIWQDGNFRLSSLNSGETSAVLVSLKTDNGYIVGRVVSESLFNFPQNMKIILFLSIFLTIFLTIFLILNLRPDTITVVQNRLKKLRISLIRDYNERKGEIDWNLWRHELEQRREDIRAELKWGIKRKPSSMQKDIDALIDKSWDEILDTIGNRRETPEKAEEPEKAAVLDKPEEVSEVEEIFEVEEISEVEELEEAAEVEELDEAEEPEELAEVEEIPEIEEISEVEELEEAAEPDLGIEVEIVSPLSEMLSPIEEKSPVFTDDTEDVGDTKTSGRLEELSSDYSMSLVYKPFQNEGAGEIQDLPPAGTGVIKQRNGIHYVDKSVKTPNEEMTLSLDPGLKNLVDSVIRKK